MFSSERLCSDTLVKSYLEGFDHFLDNCLCRPCVEKQVQVSDCGVDMLPGLRENKAKQGPQAVQVLALALGWMVS